MTSSSSPIRFYELTDPFGDFSNYALYPITIDDVKYPTSEHAYQAAKFTDEEFVKQIIQASTPNKARELARQQDLPNHRWAWRRELNVKIQDSLKRGVKCREDWDEIKEDVMLKILRAKFQQHEKLGKLLLSTGDAEISEFTKRDRFWANWTDNLGKNRLGYLLMQVRSELKA